MAPFAQVPDHVEEIGGRVVGAALNVHKAFGPGLLENAYEVCLAAELEGQGLAVKRQESLPVVHNGVRVKAGYRVDLLVEDVVIVEVKAIEALSDLHVAQILTYLRLSGCRLGYLMNFNVRRLKDGLRRVVL